MDSESHFGRCPILSVLDRSRKPSPEHVSYHGAKAEITAIACLVPQPRYELGRCTTFPDKFEPLAQLFSSLAGGCAMLHVEDLAKLHTARNVHCSMLLASARLHPINPHASTDPLYSNIDAVWLKGARQFDFSKP